MTMDWKSKLRELWKPREIISPVCPICHELLKAVELTDYRECKNGHRFGPGMKRVPLINDGDFHGEL